jgi:predicted transcriptional regulator
MGTGKTTLRAEKSKVIESNLPAMSARLTLARIDAGIDDANNGRFATKKQVETEFARWRQGETTNSIGR